MKKLLGILLLILIGLLSFSCFYNFYKSGIRPEKNSLPFAYRSSSNERNSKFLGKDAYKDKFAVYVGEIEEEEIEESVLGEETVELPYKKVLIEMPLYSGDYYYGKHINASAAVKEINQKVPILKPGDRIVLIGNGYLTMNRGWGYVKPGADFMYASGVCWSTSALGTLMDEANKEFVHKYELPLFVFYYGDRLPHPHAYSTYRNSNYGYGYSVVRVPNGASADFKFTVNPELKNHSKFSELEIKIRLVSETDNPQAFLGQAIGGYIETNVDF